MGNPRGSADSVIGEGPIRTEFFLCPADSPVLVATVNMPSAPGAELISLVWTSAVRWAFVLERNDPHVSVTLTVDGLSGETVQSITQYPRNNRHREDMKKFMEELQLLRTPRKSKAKEGTKADGNGPKQSDTEKKVPRSDSGVPSGDDEGGNGSGEAEIPSVDQ